MNQEYLKSILRYDPETGLFTWLVKRGRGTHAVPGKVTGTTPNTKDGYVRIGIDGKQYRAHLLAWLYMTGAWPEHEVDHEDNNGANNRWKNLRRATHAENCRNRKRPNTNTSGFKGVSWNKRDKKWRAQIKVDGEIVHLGDFRRKRDAAASYREASKVHHGRFGRVA